MLKRLYKKLFTRSPKDHFPGFAYPIEEAFTANGITYYKFQDVNNICCLRALKTITFYTEMQMRCDYKYLKRHVEAVDKELSGKSGKIDIYKLKTYNDYLKARLEWVMDTDLVYKLASVVYFDKNENPLEYDMVYNQKKIEQWKENIPINDFFLSMPIMSLVPFLKDLEMNIREYSMVTELIKKEQLKNISSN